MKLFNSLTREVEEFEPVNPPEVKMYTCGPTVYNYPTIGNWRTYVLSDLLARSLAYLGFQVEYVMNITDVGHLVSDADTGEDKLEKGARREGKTAWEVANFYMADFLTGFEKLNMLQPKIFSRATEHIKEQIDLVKRIEEKGMVYQTSDGIYFDTVEYEKRGNVYGGLSNLDQIIEGARVEVNPEKKDPRDFALWKFSPAGVKRDMEWDSPWGVGFPGWHIECSAMSMKYLGEQLDIHVGGEDLKSTHHPNEIAQSEAVTGKKPFSRFWVHGAFLLVDGGRMGKSLGNAFTLHDVVERGFDPLDLRYFCLSGHYRKQLNFTWEALGGARAALSKLRQLVAGWEEPATGCAEFEERFKMAIEDDLNMPEALAVVWEMAKSDYPGSAKKKSILKFDEVLGLGLKNSKTQRIKESKQVPDEIKRLLEERERLREEKRFEEADKVRGEIELMGYIVEDFPEGSRVLRK